MYSDSPEFMLMNYIIFVSGIAILVLAAGFLLWLRSRGVWNE